MSCINQDGRPIENTDTGECASCGAARRKAERMPAPKEKNAIAKVSASMAKKLATYSGEKAKWITGKRCAVYPDKVATEIHHMCGRVGYHDEWARENDVPLLLDKRFWLPVSHEGHERITANSQWASENQFTFLRVTDPVFRKQ